MLRKFFIIFSAALLPFISGFANNNELLSKNDVSRVMGEIFSQHVDKKEMTGDVLKLSFQSYIDQFDPDRIYFTQNEVDQLVTVSPEELDLLLQQYTSGQLTRYEEINQAIQKAILRSREYRKELLTRMSVLFQKSSTLLKDLKLGDNDRRPFADSAAELKKRISDQLILFISSERQRYGDQAVMQNQKRTMQAFLEAIQHRENQYLYTDEYGKQLSDSEQENLFVMHVLKAIARSLDSHTSFLDRNEALDMRIRLEKGFKGIGVVLKKKPEGVVITRLIEDGPAKKSGQVQAGDRISEINGQFVEEDSLEELVEKLRDEKKGKVVLVLKRDVDGKEEIVQVALGRELIAVDEGRVDVDYVPYGNGILGKIVLHSFYQGNNGVTSEKDVRAAIKELKDQGKLKGLILDLRENSGGFLNQAVKVAGLFITNGVVVISKYSNGEERYYRDMDGKVSFDGPLIILTSKATASAAEIVAQALQDYGVALVVGDEQTYGKGTIQSQTVTDGSSVSHFKVTVGKYYTVSGRTPQVRGVEADIIVPSYYSKELIGEEYLENPVQPDQINQAYHDPLSDVDPGLKPWYLRYYMPTLQTKSTSWHSSLNALQNKSRLRLAQNSTYQKFLKGEGDWNPFLDPDEKLPVDLDFQMQEAVSILKDMILLDQSVLQRSVAEY
jgi:carboxyl-terminal processing protease